MKSRIPLLTLFFLFNLAFVYMLTAQENHQFKTEIIDGEEIVVSYKSGNGDGGTRNNYPPIWENPAGGGSTMGIIVKFESNPRVNDVPLEAGDFIGGFYTDDEGNQRCGGASPWPGNLGVVVSLRGDNPETPEKDGFTFQEQIYFRLFSWERMKEYIVDEIDFDPNSPTTDKWISLGLSEVINIQALVDFDFYISASANPICISNEVVLAANEFVGSTGNYTYDWYSDPPGFDFDIPDPPATIPLETTTYFLTVSDGSQVSEHFLTVNVNNEPEVSVSDDGTICEDDIFSLSAEASDYSTILWTTDGDGYFTNSNGLNTEYYPGPDDKVNGEVLFTFTAQPIVPCTMPATDLVSLTINQYPVVDAGQDMSGCEDEPGGVPVSATGIDFETVLWTTEGDGTFEDPESIATVYFPGPTDISMGDVDLEICVYSTAPCNGTDCDEVNVEFFSGPTCNAPPQLSKCENEPIQLAGIAFNNDGLLWTTQGDGTFDDATIINAKYYAGENDKLTGQTVVTLNAFAIEPCTVPATKDVTLIFFPLPRLSTFGEGTDNLCPNENFLQLDADLEHYTSFAWSTNGDGTFSGSNTLDPEYYPGTGDYQNESFELEITAGPVSPCTLSRTFTLFTNIYSEPSVDIQTESGTASCGTISLNVETIDVESLSWSTSGDGTFDAPTGTSTQYFPGPVDLASPAFVTISVEGVSPCPGITPAQDVVEIFFRDNVDVSAGEDANICETENYELTQAEATDYETLAWATSGDGTFDNPTDVNPVYFPGANDISNGQVNLSITGASILPCVIIDTDEMQLLISDAPEVDAGTNATICDTESHQIQNALALNFSSIFWESSGDGFFNDVSIQNTTYFPGDEDIISGEVILTLNVLGIDPCSFLISDNQVLTIQQSPEAFAGNDGTICDTESYEITDSDAENFSEVFWETSGDGSFSNGNEVSTEYFPGLLDIASGNVTLTLNVAGISPCNFEVIDSQTLTIQKSPEAEAGFNATICDVDNHLIGNASADHYSTLSWETTGDGSFSDVNIINPVYFPGSGDIASGIVVLTINAFGINPCNFVVSDNLTLSFQPSPVADAGSDATICEVGNHLTDDASAEHFTTVFWETSGDGTFINPNEINTEYLPGSADINGGNVLLTLYAVGINPCNFENFDSHVLTIQQSPVADAGPDEEICETEEHQINAAFAENYSSLNWETSGDGTFSDPGIIDPFYFPGAFDIIVGSASLTLHVIGIDPCSFEVSDSHVLNLQMQPDVDAGSDEAICNTNVLMISEAFADNTTSLNWETSGDGTFSDPSSLNTLYVPGSSDINGGSVTLTLNATGIAPCNFEVSDAFDLSIQESPEVDAGPDATICENSTHPIQGAAAENYNALLWLTSGDGTFSNQGDLNPTYFPGSGDVITGTVNLTLLATGVTPCYYPAIDEHQLFIQPLPAADAGSDLTSCNEATLSGSVENASSILWSTTGDGTFSDPELTDPVYYPGPGDLASLSAEIQLTAFPLEPCTQPTSDDLLITFDIPTIVEDLDPSIEVTTGELLFIEFEVSNPSSGTFTWFKNGELLPQYTTGTLWIIGVTTNDFGTYQSVFTNECGEVASTEAFIQVLDPFVQIINLEAGWQGISSFVEADITDIPVLFQPIENQVEILSDNQGFYWPAQSVNTLGPWSNTAGYRLKMNADATLSIEGVVRYPRESLAIQPGWSYLPVNSSCPLDIDEIFGAYPSITIVKDMAGSAVYLPGFGVNNLENLEPGKAYQIYNSGDIPVVIDLPECD